MAAFGLIILIPAIFALCVFFINIKIASITPAVGVFAVTSASLYMLRKAWTAKKALLMENLKATEKVVQGLKDGDAKLNSELKKLDETVSEIVSLYEITKAMSGTLLFSEILQLFSEFLKKNFIFISCELILADRADAGTGKVYKIEAPQGGAYPEKTIAAKQEVPLTSQNEIIGVLNIAGLEDGALEKFLIVSRQFSLEIEKVRLYETVQQLAITDGLTGVFVRRYFLDMLKEELERSLKHNFRLSFLMVDLDHFKECNDKLGHLVGDVILKDAARMMKKNIREIDIIGRYGGEEFALLLPETDKGSAAVAAERLRWAIANRSFKAYDEVVNMTISVGLSTFPDNAKTVEELIDTADKALYEAKAQGRNRVVVFRGG